MGLYTKLLGTISGFFQVGGPAGSGLANNAGALEVRTANQSSLTIMRGADPIGLTDFVTKQYLDGYQFPGGSTSVTQVQIDFGTTPTRSKQFTITDPTVTPSTYLIVNQSGVSASGRTVGEPEMDPMVFSATPGSGAFTVTATTLNGPVVGRYLICYLVG